MIQLLIADTKWWQHIAVGVLVLLLLPLMPRRWLTSQGLGFSILMLGVAFGQVLVGVLKSGSGLSNAKSSSLIVATLILFIGGAAWMVCKARQSHLGALEIGLILGSAIIPILLTLIAPICFRGRRKIVGRPCWPPYKRQRRN